MASKAKKPAGWYGKAAKAERKVLAAIKRQRRERDKRDAETARKSRQARAEREKSLADAIGARVEKKAAAGRLRAEEAHREYSRQAKELRRELRETPKSYDKQTGELIDVAPPHARRQHRKTSIERMIDARQITPAMMQAAQEIERVYLALTGGVLIRSQGYERQDRGTGDPMSEVVALAYHKRYKPWADELSRRRKACAWPMLEVVIDVVIDGRSFDVVERDLRLAHGTAKFIVQWALLDYAEKAGFCKRGERREFESAHGVKRIPKSFSMAA